MTVQGYRNEFQSTWGQAKKKKFYNQSWYVHKIDIENGLEWAESDQKWTLIKNGPKMDLHHHLQTKTIFQMA